MPSTSPFFLRHGLLCAAWSFTPASLTAQWNVADSSGAYPINAVAPYTATGYIGISNVLHLSTDAGMSWVQRSPQFIGFPLFGIWRDAHFTSANEGYMAGAFDLDNAYTILRTTDGGSNWTAAYSNEAGSWPRRFNALHYPTPSIGYAAGTNGRVVRTQNGGQSWTPVASTGSGHLFSVHFFDANAGLVAGTNTLARTTDGGATWSNALTVLGDHVLAANGSVAVAGGPGAVHISTDNGQNWTTRTAPFQRASSMHVFSALAFVVVDASTNTLYITRTGGLYWERAVLPVEGFLEAVHFNDAQNGCLVGGTGGEHSLIMTTTNGPGIGTPVVSIAATVAEACGSVTYSLDATGADPAWQLAWYRNGQQVGTGTEVDVTYTTTGSTDIELRASNGTHTGVAVLQQGVTVYQPLDLDVMDDVVLCSGGSTTLGVQGAPSGATYSWQPSAGLSSTTAAEPVVSGLATSVNYTVQVAHGPCTAQRSVLVEVLPPIPALQPTTLLDSTRYGMFHFTDAYNGFAVQQDTIWVTHDGGLSWIHRLVDVDEEWPQARLCMVDPLNGFVNNGWNLMRTTDGWATYTTYNNNLLIQGNYKKRVYALPDGELLLHCRSGSTNDRFMRSVDGGGQWTLLPSNFTRIYDIAAAPGGLVLAGGGSGVSNPSLYRSINAGQTWGSVAMPEGIGMISDLEITSDGTAYAVSYDEIWRSLDDGLTWELNFQRPFPTSSGNICSISFQGPDSGFASFSGEVWRTVNGGACWQRDASQPDAWEMHFQSLGNEVTFYQSGVSIFSRAGLRRTHPPTGGLQFLVETDTICTGSIPWITNNSSGGSAYTWSIDGAFHSADTQTTLPVLAPGAHTITLQGTIGGVTSTLTKDLFVESFNAAPVLALEAEPCWLADTVRIMATTEGPAYHYAWYRQATPDPVLLPGSGNPYSVLSTATSTSYFAIPISAAGCQGAPSEPIAIVATDAMPAVEHPAGDVVICTTSGAVETTYTSAAASGHPDITGFLWTMTPPTAGTLIADGTTCTVQWNSAFGGTATLHCQGMDACGAGPASSTDILVDPGIHITQQPADITVDLGEAFTLAVTFAEPQPANGQWFKDGVVVGDSPIYTVAAADMDHAGHYHWSGTSAGACAELNSDTVLVTVVDGTGLPVRAPVALLFYPNPFDQELYVEVPDNTPATRFTIYDSAGRAVQQHLLPASDRMRYRMGTEGLGAGVFILELADTNWQHRAHVVKLP